MISCSTKEYQRRVVIAPPFFCNRFHADGMSFYGRRSIDVGRSRLGAASAVGDARTSFQAAIEAFEPVGRPRTAGVSSGLQPRHINPLPLKAGALSARSNRNSKTNRKDRLQ